MLGRAGGGMTASDLAAAIWGPDAAEKPSAVLGMSLMLSRMQRRRFVARQDAHPENRYDLGDEGREVLAELAIPRPPRRYKSTKAERLRQRKRRADAAEQKRCINENSRGTHGPATHGVRCKACHEVHQRSA